MPQRLWGRTYWHSERSEIITNQRQLPCHDATKAAAIITKGRALGTVACGSTSLRETSRESLPLCFPWVKKKKSAMIDTLSDPDPCLRWRCCRKKRFENEEAGVSLMHTLFGLCVCREQAMTERIVSWGGMAVCPGNQ